jgi:hypothetical protein
MKASNLLTWTQPHKKPLLPRPIWVGDCELGGQDYSRWHFEVRSDSGSLNAPAFLSE